MTSAKYLAVAVVLSVSGLVFGQVTFNDANLELAVEAELGILDPTAAQMLGLTELNASSAAIGDLTGLDTATNLTQLRIFSNNIVDISPLSGLTSLELLFIGHNNIADISPLSGLTNLRRLLLADNAIVSISALSGLTSLTELQLSENQISDISALSGLTDLTTLYLFSNDIANISALSGLTDLTQLRLYANDIVDISALSTLSNLMQLWLASNDIVDVSALTGLTSLTQLILSSNPLSQAACEVQIPLIFANNPGVSINSSCGTYYSLGISSTAGGTVVAPGEGSFVYLDGTSAPVSATADAGYHFVNWTGTAVDTGKVDDPSSAGTLVTVDSDYTLVANFAISAVPQYTVNVSSTAGGSTDKDGNNTVNHGDTLVINPTANAGFNFMGWTGNASGSADPLTVTVTSNMAITANFGTNQYIVTVSSTAGGSTDKDGANAVNLGDTLVINPTANAGSYFSGWTGSASGSADPLTVTVTSNMAITANFGTNQYTVTVSSTAGGSTDKDGANAVNHGDTLVVNPTPNTGSNFTGWTGSASGSADPLTLTVTSDMAITANFATTQYTVAVSSTAGGSTDKDGNNTVNHGDTLVINPTPNAGSSFTGWTGSASGSVDPLTVTVTSNMAITANFTNQYTVTVSSTAGGSTDKDGSHTVNHGDTLVINPTPNAGYHLTGWTGDASGSSDPLTVTVTSSRTITANFAINQYTVTVNSSAGGSTDKDGSNTVDHGDTLTLMPSASTNHEFTGWTGDAAGTDAPLTVTVTSAMSITANFEAIVKPPSVATYPARFVGQTSVTLMGYVTDDGGEADYEYRFSLWKQGEPEPGAGNDSHHSAWTAKKSLYGKSTFTADFPEDGRLTLDPGSTYEYRAIGRNSAGYDRGGVRQFTTLAAPGALYVDDDGPSDPGPYDMSISDPQEDGTEAHPFDSIQEAIEAARQHETVVVSEGVYAETINFMGKNIHVTGFDLSTLGTTTYGLLGEHVSVAGFGPSVPGSTSYPVIDAVGLGTVVTFNHSEDPNCTLSGFVLTGGYGNPAGAIFCDGSSPSIRNCLIVGNRCPDPDVDEPNGAAVFCVDSDSVFENCTIAGNYAGANGVGLYSVDSNVIIANSILWGNLPAQVQVESGNDPIIVNSDVQGTWPGLGNIAEHPSFVQPGYWADRNDPWLWPTDPADPEALWIMGDFRLEEGSPCIDAGDANWLYLNHPDYYREATNMGAYGYIIRK
jgi:uncharacterized repeat protein (TIGR02543 family)